MKPFLIATFMILWLGLGPTNKAQAQIVYGYSVPLDDGGADSSGYSPGGYFPGTAGYSGMMYPWGYYPGNYGSSRGSTAGNSPFNTGNWNRTWSNQTFGSNRWNGFSRGSESFQPSTFMIPTGMNSGFGGMTSMGMRRR
ncbi:MAG TPA: hypothetical protein VG122_16165 [Gemmata sp.]|nr:hypothetical protein [Gemmata sp.]